MEFNPQLQLAGLLEWMHTQLEACHGRTAVIGISGGKDSSTVAALAAAAYGRERVYGVLMPDGVQPDIDYSQALVEHLRIPHCTIYGDSAGAFSPLGMYTTEEVIALGRQLGLPEKFLIKPPSDGLTGLTDEDNLGFTYHAVNEYVRRGVVDPAIKEQIDAKHRASRFKFQTIPVYHNGLPMALEDETNYYK